MKSMTTQNIMKKTAMISLMMSKITLAAGAVLAAGVLTSCAQLDDAATQTADQDHDDTDVSSTEATLSQDADAALAACDPNVGFTIKDGDFIKGSGSLPCAGTARVTLQRTILGVWGDDLTSVTLNGAGDARSVVWNCRGAGRHTYRTYITWRKVSGLPGFKESNHIEVNC